MSFPLIGNSKISSAIESAISADRIPHALILEGEAGTGRHTLADYISRAILCTGSKKPCGNCRSCKLANSKTHPDIITVEPLDKKKSILVDQIRELRQKAFIKPHIANRKVLIISRAETMNEQAQNALLKILEEPPASVYFILITDTAAALLDTVLSRCVKFTVSVPGIDEGAKWIAESQKPKRDIQLIKTALLNSKGNIGRAVALLKKKNSESPEDSACEFAGLLFDGNEFDMLCILNRFEKDRPAADVFFSSLKYEISSLLSGNYKSGGRAKLLTELYSLTDGFSDSLKTNINLSLLFTAVVSAVEALRKTYLYSK